MKRSYSLIAALALLAAPSLIAQHEHKHDECTGKETAAKQETAKPYPLETCVVSGEKLGEMGKPYVFVHEGQEIKLCCKHCQPKFYKNPAKCLAKLKGNSAVSKSKAHSSHQH